MKRFKVRSIQVLDNTEQDWREHGLFPRTPEGGFGANNAHIVERRSETVLYVMNTEGYEMLFEVKP